LQEASLFDPQLADQIQHLKFQKSKSENSSITNFVLNSQKIFETFGIRGRSRAGELKDIIKTIYPVTNLPANQVNEGVKESGADASNILEKSSASDYASVQKNKKKRRARSARRPTRKVETRKK
jgi:hypothetical protein